MIRLPIQNVERLERFGILDYIVPKFRVVRPLNAPLRILPPVSAPVFHYDNAFWKRLRLFATA